jgi:hypothetical protein
MFHLSSGDDLSPARPHLAQTHCDGTQATDGAAAAAMPWYKGGGAGWLVIAALVVAWDLAAPETLSAAFRRARSGPIGSAVVIAAWACLTAHLFQALPDRADPFHALLNIAKVGQARTRERGT